MDNDDFDRIRKYARLLFSVEDVEVLASVDIKGNENRELAFRRGRLESIADVREQIIDLAKKGDTSASKQFIDIMKASEDSGGMF